MSDLKPIEKVMTELFLFGFGLVMFGLGASIDSILNVHYLVIYWLFIWFWGILIMLITWIAILLVDKDSPDDMPSSKATRGRALGSEAVRSEDEGS